MVVDQGVYVVEPDLGRCGRLGGGSGRGRASRRRRGSCRASSRPCAPARRAGRVRSGPRWPSRLGSARRSADRSRAGTGSGGGAGSAPPCAPAPRARQPTNPARDAPGAAAPPSAARPRPRSGSGRCGRADRSARPASPSASNRPPSDARTAATTPSPSRREPPPSPPHDPPHQQAATVERQPGITVRHEDLRAVWDLDKPHPTRGFSSVKPTRLLPTSWPGTPRWSIPCTWYMRSTT